MCTILTEDPSFRTCHVGGKPEQEYQVDDMEQGAAITIIDGEDIRVRYGVTRLEVLLKQLTKQRGQPNVCVWVTNPYVVPIPCRVLKPWHYYKTLVTEVMVVSGTKLITNRRTMKLPVEIAGLYSYADLCPKLIRYELVNGVFVFTEPENL